MKRLAFSVLLLAMVGIGAVLASSGLAEPPSAEVRSDDEKLISLLKERCATLREIVDEAEWDHRDGMVSSVLVARVTVDWLTAELELAADHAARIAIRERILEHLRKAEAALTNEKRSTPVTSTKGHERTHSESYDFLAMKAARCQAEIELYRERANKR